MPDGDGTSGDVSEELKRTGQSLISQITGASTNAQSGATLNPSDQLGGFGKSVLGQITGTGDDTAAAQSQTQDAGDQLGGFDKSILGQVTGTDSSGESSSTNHSQDHGGFWGEMKAFGTSMLGQISGKELAEMKQKDDEMSKAEGAQVKAKIQSIYEEHAQKQMQEAHFEQQQGKQVEVQKKEIKKERKKESMDVSIAQTRANAEIKNMGAE